MAERSRKYPCRATVVFSSEGGNSERFLSFCLQRQLPLSHIISTPLGFQATVAAAQYAGLRSAARKNGCKIRILQKNGIWFRVFPHWKYFGILLGIVLAGALLSIKGLVWNIEYYNVDTTDIPEVEATLFRAGVYRGSIVDDRRLDEAERRVLETTDRYAGMALNYTKGKLVVEGRKLTATPEMAYASQWDIFANSDGVIRSVEVYAGESKVVSGQSVQKGELLVQSGWYDQQGLYRLAPARARIMAYVEGSASVACPMRGTSAQTEKVSRKIKAILFCDRQLRLQNPQGTDYFCGVDILGIPLPVTVVYTLTAQQTQQPFTLTEREAKRQCTQTLEQMIYARYESVEFLSREYTFTPSADFMYGTVVYTAYADIACAGE